MTKADVVKLDTMRWEQGRALNKPGCYLMWFVFGNHGLCYEVDDSYDCIVFMTGENMQNEPTWKTLSSTSKPIPGSNMSSCLHSMFNEEYFKNTLNIKLIVLSKSKVSQVGSQPDFQSSLPRVDRCDKGGVERSPGRGRE